jgi:nicotinate-nucleotide adenylyltransferase
MTEMSPKRFHHTAAVEDMVTRLATLYCPEEIPALRAAALLHDITKEYDIPTHIALLTQAGIPPKSGEEYAHKTFHARTAALLIPDNYPAFNCETVVNAVRWHTTGREGMTLTEKLLYLADYIDDSRLFPDCVRLRAFFWDAHPERMTMEDKLTHLRRTLIMSFDMTMRALLAENAVISADTAHARNELVLEELTAGRR